MECSNISDKNLNDELGNDIKEIKDKSNYFECLLRYGLENKAEVFKYLRDKCIRIVKIVIDVETFNSYEYKHEIKSRFNQSNKIKKSFIYDKRQCVVYNKFVKIMNEVFINATIKGYKKIVELCLEISRRPLDVNTVQLIDINKSNDPLSLEHDYGNLIPKHKIDLNLNIHDGINNTIIHNYIDIFLMISDKYNADEDYYLYYEPTRLLSERGNLELVQLCQNRMKDDFNNFDVIEHGIKGGKKNVIEYGINNYLALKCKFGSPEYKYTEVKRNLNYLCAVVPRFNYIRYSKMVKDIVNKYKDLVKNHK